MIDVLRVYIVYPVNEGASIAYCDYHRDSNGGCLSNNSEELSPKIDGSNITLEPGDERTLTISGEHVTSLAFFERSDPDSVEIDVGDGDVSPPPDTIDESFPPTLHWSAPESVEYSTSVRISEGANSGEYNYGVSGSGGTSSDEREIVRKEFTITVV